MMMILSYLTLLVLASTAMMAVTIFRRALIQRIGWHVPFRQYSFSESSQPQSCNAPDIKRCITFTVSAFGNYGDSSPLSLVDELRFTDDNPANFGLRRQVNYSRNSRNSRPDVLENTVLVTPTLFPSVCEAANAAVSALHITSAAEFYIRPSPYTQAACAYLGNDCPIAVILHSGLIELLSTEELRFVIGHEMGHYLFRHPEYSLNKRENGSAPRRHAYFAWRRAAEISADRVGLVCSGSDKIAIAAMLKSASGLSNRHLNIDAEAFQEQAIMSESLGNNAASQHSHPSLPLRARAIHWFAMSRSCPQLNNIPHIETRAQHEVDKLIREDLAEATLHKKDSPAAEKIASRAMLWSLLIYFVADGNISQAEEAILVKSTNSSDAAKAIKFVTNYGIQAAQNKHNDAVYRLCMITMDERKVLIHKLKTALGEAATDHASVDSFILSLKEKMGIS